MKKELLEVAGLVLFGPIVATGKGMQLGGEFLIAGGEGLRTAGVKTELGGRVMRAAVQAKALEAEANAAFRAHEAAKAKLLRIIGGLTAECQKQKRRNEELEAALKAAEVEYATLIAQGVASPAAPAKKAKEAFETVDAVLVS